MIAVVGVLGLVSVGIHLGYSAAIRAAFGHAGVAWQAMTFFSGFLLRVGANFLLFFSIFMIVPNRRQQPRVVAKGALFTGVAFLILQYALDLYFGTLSNATVLYGSIGVFISVLVWLYLTGMVTFLGAELVAGLGGDPKDQD